MNHAAGAAVVTVNQEAGGGQWALLGTWDFNAGAGTVSLSDAANEYVIADALMLVPPNAPPNTATWTLAIPATKDYRVYARWTAHPNRASDAKYTVNTSAGAATVTVDQQAASGQWNLLGTWNFAAGNASVSLTDQANGYVIADAIRFDPTDAPPDAATWTPALTQPTRFEVYARWTAHPNRATDAAYSITHSQGTATVSANQQANGGVWNLLGTYTFNPGQKIALAGDANGYVIADAIRLVPTPDQPSATALYFIYPDHLGTPRLIADAAGTTVWRWDQQEPFGDDSPNGDPNSTGTTFDFPPRFPGQYADKETGLAYNYYRDYDSGIGRYVQSDPIGLVAGLNTYLYVTGNPVTLVDPDGRYGLGVAVIVGVVALNVGISTGENVVAAVAGYVTGKQAGDALPNAIDECTRTGNCGPATAAEQKKYSGTSEAVGPLGRLFGIPKIPMVGATKKIIEMCK